MNKKAFLAFVLILLLPGGTVLRAAEKSKAEKSKTELNFVLGSGGGEVGAFKSLGWYFVGRFVSAEVNVAIVKDAFPLCGNLTLHLPLWRFIPYVTGGLGFSLTGFGVTNAGGGLKVRLTERIGILFEYRSYTYKIRNRKTTTPLIGGGISYLF